MGGGNYAYFNVLCKSTCLEGGCEVKCGVHSQDSLLLSQGSNHQLLEYKAEVTVVLVPHSVTMDGCGNYTCIGKYIDWLALCQLLASLNDIWIQGCLVFHVVT
jgi:hypothetical protein